MAEPLVELVDPMIRRRPRPDHRSDPAPRQGELLILRTAGDGLRRERGGLARVPPGRVEEHVDVPARRLARLVGVVRGGQAHRKKADGIVLSVAWCAFAQSTISRWWWPA